MINIYSHNVALNGAFGITCMLREIKRTGHIDINVYTYYPDVFKNNPYVSNTEYARDWWPHLHIGEDSIEVNSSNILTDGHINITLCENIGIQCLDIHPELYMGKDEVDDSITSHGLPNEYILIASEEPPIANAIGDITSNVKYPVYYMLTKIAKVPGGIPIDHYNIRDLFSIVSKAKCIVTSRIDSIIHVASALNVPTLVLLDNIVDARNYAYPCRQLILVYNSIDKLNRNCLVSNMENVISGARGIISL